MRLPACGGFRFGLDRKKQKIGFVVWLRLDALSWHRGQKKLGVDAFMRAGCHIAASSIEIDWVGSEFFGRTH